MGRKILLADDSVTIQKVVNLTFSDEGIDVVSVGNGDVALSRIEEERPDIVLADIFMPGKNGYEVCEYIKNNPQHAHIPVLLLVGAFEPFDQAEAKRVGADGHLTKPFESRALVSLVHSYLDKYPPLSNNAQSETHPLTLSMNQQIDHNNLEQPQLDTPFFQPLPTVNEFVILQNDPSDLVANNWPLPQEQAQATAEIPVIQLELDLPLSGTAGRYTTGLNRNDPLTEALADVFALDEQSYNQTQAVTATDEAGAYDAIAPLREPEEELITADRATDEAGAYDAIAPDAVTAETGFALLMGQSAPPAVDEIDEFSLEEIVPLDSEALESATAMEQSPTEPSAAYESKEIVEDIPLEVLVSSDIDEAPFGIIAQEPDYSTRPLSPPTTMLVAEEPFASATGLTQEMSISDIESLLGTRAEPQETMDWADEVRLPEILPVEDETGFAFSKRLTDSPSSILTDSSRAAMPIESEVEEIIPIEEAMLNSYGVVVEEIASPGPEPTLEVEAPHPVEDRSPIITISDPVESPIPVVSVEPETAAALESAAPAPQLSIDNIPEQLIEEIVRRVIARMSDSVVREIAWEVVPDLAELLIKKLLEQKKQ